MRCGAVRCGARPSLKEAFFLQVTEEMVNILAASGHSCHLRGPIFVKGKGTITTYFVKTPFDKSQT